jgi:AcrR family transcriptional regulator
MARTAGSHSDITGPKVRRAALRLFASHGYAAVSMRQIASVVGVQAGALYNYTPDKQSLLFDLMLSHMQELLAAHEDDVSLPPLKRLEAFVRFHIDFHKDRPDEVFIAYMELRNLTEDNFEQIETLRRAYETRVEAILQAGVASQDLTVKDTRIATRAIIAMLNGVNLWFREDGALTLEEVQHRHLELVMGAVGAKA